MITQNQAASAARPVNCLTWASPLTEQASRQLNSTTTDDSSRHSVERRIPAQEYDASSDPDIPGYGLLHALGAGGQGRVWLAIRLDDNQRVAIKVIDRTHLENDRAKARFEQGFETLANIQHAGIVRPIEHGVLPTGELWHATQYVPGRTLIQHVEHLDEHILSHSYGQRSGKFPLRPVLELFARICEVVEAAHRAGVIHRDLKPSNIIVDGEGQPHLVDFGVAKSSRPVSPALVTLTDQFLGSPAWASPEQVEARPGCTDLRSDIYSLGIMLYQLVTQTFPYRVDGPLARVFDQILHADPKPPRAVARWVDADLQAVMLKSIAKEPARRYQTAVEFREDIERYLTGLPVRAKGDGPGYVLRKLVRRHRALVAAGCVACLLTLAYLVHITALYRRASVAQHAASAERDRARTAEAAALAAAQEARRKFRMAQETAGFIAGEVIGKLETVAGTGAVRKELAEEAYEKLHALAREAADDPALQADLAQIYVRMGDLAYRIGDGQRAESDRRAALAIRERLAAAEPNNAAAQEALSTITVLMGDLDKDRGDMAEARRRYEAALAIDERLATAYPEQERYQENLSYSDERVADSALRAGEFERAAQLMERRHALAVALAEARPDDLRCKANLLESHLNLAELAHRRSKGTEGRGHRRAAAGLAEQLLAAEPSNPRYLQLRITTILNAVDDARNVGPDEGAIADLPQAAECARRLASAEPGNHVYASLLAAVLTTQAGYARDRGDLETARRLMEDAVTIHSRLGTAVREAPLHLGPLWNSLCELSSYESALGRDEDAYRHAVEARRLGRRLAEDPQADPITLAAVAATLLNSSPAGPPDPAEALALADCAANRTGDSSPFVLLVLAQANEAVGDRARAAAAARRGLQLVPPGDSLMRRHLDARLKSTLSFEQDSQEIRAIRPIP